jgi:peptidyl-prolyl cis-trans isomerase C
MISLRKILNLAALSAILIANPVFAQNAAIVNGKSIPKAQLDKLVQKTGQADNPQIRDQAREMLVTRELILQEADKRGLSQSEAVKEQIEQSRIGILVAAVFQDFVEKEGITEAELKAAYETAKTQYTGKEYHVEHILVEKESDAKAITAQIKAGGNFEEIANNYSGGVSFKKAMKHSWKDIIH